VHRYDLRIFCLTEHERLQLKTLQDAHSDVSFQVPERQREGHVGSEERTEQEPGTISGLFIMNFCLAHQINLEQESHIVIWKCL
jgi:hypothetical protein